MEWAWLVSSLTSVGGVVWGIMYLLGYLVTIYMKKLFHAFFPRQQKSLRGEVILLTGSANGVGKEVAHELGGLGATLVLWDVDGQANDVLVAQLHKMGTKVYGYTVDISERENIVKAAQRVREEVGDVTIIFNNAGIAPYSAFMKLNAELLTKVFQVNLFAEFWILREFVPSMIENGRGHVVSMASLNAFMPNRDQPIYASTKFAMTGFLDSFREEIRDHPKKPQINITTIYPIFIQTRMLDGNRVVPKFSSLAPTLTPDYVAKEAVKAFRQNYDHVFLPPSAQIFAMLTAILPMKFMHQLQAFLLKPNPVEEYSEAAATRGLHNNIN